MLLVKLHYTVAHSLPDTYHPIPAGTYTCFRAYLSANASALGSYQAAGATKQQQPFSLRSQCSWTGSPTRSVTRDAVRRQTSEWPGTTAARGQLCPWMT